MELAEFLTPENILKIIGIIAGLAATGFIIKKIIYKINLNKKSITKSSSIKNKSNVIGLFNKSHNGDITNNYNSGSERNEKERD